MQWSTIASKFVRVQRNKLIIQVDSPHMLVIFHHNVRTGNLDMGFVLPVVSLDFDDGLDASIRRCDENKAIVKPFDGDNIVTWQNTGIG